MSSSDPWILFVASAVAGAVNSVAGGGSLITFPVLVWLGREPILANATNTVSLAPGSLAALHGLRRELAGLQEWIWRGTWPSLAGGVLGAVLLLATPAVIFKDLVPFLILFATGLFALSGPINAAARRRAGHATGSGIPDHPAGAPFLFYQLAVSIYGGYFGAGIGIMMHAGLALAGFTAIHRALALRNYYAVLINGIAAVYFIAFGAVAWGDALVLTAGQIVGGFVGARTVRNLPATTVQWVVVVVGVVMAVSLFR
jgi:hypothetical protein